MCWLFAYWWEEASRQSVWTQGDTAVSRLTAFLGHLSPALFTLRKEVSFLSYTVAEMNPAGRVAGFPLLS